MNLAPGSFLRNTRGGAAIEFAVIGPAIVILLIAVTDFAAVYLALTSGAPDTGWRVGHFGVLASVAAYTEGAPWLDRLLATLDDRRALLGRLLAERLPRVSWRPPEATFLAWLDCSALGSGDAPRELFFDKGRVAVEPGLRFGAAGSGHVRLNFATSAEILDEATARMAAALP